ncbi:site-specific integrase [Bernardetia sp.]|uniref:site-specific integrase n=1 Tax=Bernardetia sp. TaxID=1937974 RepID=UPI0025C0C40A|nr:site-specific integrase [Bernardetia sp.]
MKVGFLIRKTRTNKYSVCCRVSFKNDKGVPFSVEGVEIERKEDWKNERGKSLQILGKGAKKKMRILNELELDLFEIFERQKALNYPVTSSIITNLYLGNTKPALTALSVLREWTDEQKKRVKAKNTKRNYERSYLDFERFCKKNQISSLPAEKFTKFYAKKYFNFLKDIPNTEKIAWRKVRNVKNAINEAADDEIIQETKLFNLNFDVKTKIKPFVFLLQDELERIENKDFDIERLENVRVCFLFCCYTGFHFNQMQIFDKKKHLFKQNGRSWISTNRDKNNAYIGVPVYPRTQAILEKCNYKLPVISNGKFNSYLKEIADLCDIRKNLTSKVGRKTFVNMQINVHGVSKATVARMLGHKSSRTTERYYGDIDQTTIIRETESQFQ